MGNKPRGVPCEKLIESLQNSNLQPVLGTSHDMFQALGAPTMTLPLHPSLNSFSRASDSSLLGLLGQCQGHTPSLNSATQSDVLASLGKVSQNHQYQLDIPKRSWTNPAQMPSSPLWMLHQNLDQTTYPLSGLAGNCTNSAKTSVIRSIGEVTSGQSGQPAWLGGIREQGILVPDLEKAATHKLPLNSERSLTTEGFGPGESGSPRGNMMSKDVADMDTKQMDSSDGSDQNMDEQEEKNPATSQFGVGRTVSKNLVSERKRRKKLNEGLYTLRALVPRISKMDKASIIGDAIDYVRELQKQVEELQAGISDIETSVAGTVLGEELPSITDLSATKGSDGRCWEEEGSKSSETKMNRDGAAPQQDESGEQRILELDVTIMEDQIYHLRIFCTKGPGVFVQLMQSLEALGLEVLNANLTSLQDNILNTFIAEIKDWEMMKTEDVKKAIMDVASRFGLQ